MRKRLKYIHKRVCRPRFERVSQKKERRLLEFSTAAPAGFADYFPRRAYVRLVGVVGYGGPLLAILPRIKMSEANVKTARPKTYSPGNFGMSTRGFPSKSRPGVPALPMAPLSASD